MTFHALSRQFGRFEQSEFVQSAVPAGQALHRCVQAVRRGDRVVVLTGADACDRRAVLLEVGRLLGRGYCGVTRVDATAESRKFLDRLAQQGLFSQPERVKRPRAERLPDGTIRRLLIVDRADLLSSRALGAMMSMHSHEDGAALQFLLSGSPALLKQFGDPEQAGIWRSVRLALTLEHEEEGTGPKLERLRREIRRTEARLAAQRRMLEIFADS